jgi:hypothetical protein
LTWEKLTESSSESRFLVLTRNFSTAGPSGIASTMGTMKKRVVQDVPGRREVADGSLWGLYAVPMLVFLTLSFRIKRSFFIK